jgi:hypothetical protein
MARRTHKLTDDERWDDWRRWIVRAQDEAIEQEQREQTFELLRAIFEFEDGRRLRTGRKFFDWCMSNYVDASLLYVRRELDDQSNGEALRQILQEMIQFPQTVSKDRWLAAWSKLPAPTPSGVVHGGVDDPATRLPKSVFDDFPLVRFSGNPSRDHVDPSSVRHDLKQLLASCDRVQRYTHQSKAHRGRADEDFRDVTFATVYQATLTLRHYRSRYFTLLHQQAGYGYRLWRPQADDLQVFTRPFITSSYHFHWFLEPRLKEANKKNYEALERFVEEERAAVAPGDRKDDPLV